MPSSVFPHWTTVARRRVDVKQDRAGDEAIDMVRGLVPRGDVRQAVRAWRADAVSSSLMVSTYRNAHLDRQKLEDLLG